MTRHKETILDSRIKILHKILHKNRIRILHQLDKDETCACELVEKLGIANNLMSHHLKVLSDLGLIEGKDEGQHRKYNISAEQKHYVRKLLTCLPIYS